MKIVIDEAIPFIRGVFEHVADVFYIAGNQITNSILVDADALIIRTRTKCDLQLLKSTKVKVICSATIGYDHIDISYCESIGIKWFTVPGCNANSVAQYFLASLSVLHKKNSLLFENLTVGVVGYGNVGKRIVNACRVLGIKCLINDPPLAMHDKSDQFCSIEELICNSDIITLHTPLVQNGDFPTEHFINYDLLRNAKDGVVLINTSRGEVINELDILRLLMANKIGLLILDVWEGEPIIDSNLLNLSFLSTPHIAGYSADGKYNGTVGCVEIICREFNLPSLVDFVSLPLSPINPEIVMDCKNRSFEDSFSEVVLKTYDIVFDSAQLQSNSLIFEFLRNNYPNRREFGAFSLNLRNAVPDFVSKFSSLGFKIINNEK